MASMSNQAKESPANKIPSLKKRQPICILVLGMAGTGKTTFVKRLGIHLQLENKKYSIINLDPAVRDLPYRPYIDIRSTIKYKEVMKQYSLGPNGAIVTSLNLFSTKFNEVMNLVEKKEETIEYLIFDTPGQIEVFNWSASGSIIAQTLASTYPTTIVYVEDTVRSTSPQTFMANMMYSCALLYKFRLPFTIAMNKIDIIDCDFAIDWMKDLDSFDSILKNETTYASTLTSSLALALEDFYKNIDVCGVSSLTGKGFHDMITRLDACAIEYEDYREEFCKAKVNNASQSQTAVPADRDEQDLQQVRKKINVMDDMFLDLHAVECDSEEEKCDEEDVEEKRELESFQTFLQQHRDMQNERKEMEISNTNETNS